MVRVGGINMGQELAEQIDLDGDNEVEDIDDDEVEADEFGPVEPLEEINVEAYGEDIREVNECTDVNSGTREELENKDDEIKRQTHDELLALPPHGCEVFIGGLPRDFTEAQLAEQCERIGEVAEIRMVKDKASGDHKGYAFVTFRTRDLAQKAIEEFHEKELVKGRKLRCSLSQTKYKLFIGNIPKSWTEEDLRQAVEGNGPGVENIELLKDPQNSNRNRGFAFVEYYNHACADYARENMSSSHFKLDGNTPTVSWADSKNATDSAAAAQVKTVYVKNLPDGITQEKLKELFERHGEITRVVLPPAKPGQTKRDHAFIHFAERSSALKAVNETEKYEFEGQVFEASLAKPQNDRKSDPTSFPPAGYFPHYPSPGGYGFIGDPYGAFRSGFGSGGYGQPLIYGRGPTPSGMAMVPMVLPDGRLGYVLQPPGASIGPPPVKHSSRRSRSDERHGSGSDSSRGHRYRPY
ncbi:unnamed protein product [Victoria cruziana]